MCGLVTYISGWRNGFSYDEAKAFTDMLFVDTLRGWDSTGVFSVSNKGNVHMVKGALAGPDFIATQDYKTFNSDAVMDGVIMVGHNRAATRGTVNDANAHPFVVDDNIILVQNGTWNGTHNHIKDTEVDTETVAHIINEEGDIEKALQRINAAYALIWYNVKETSLYAIRNSQRPLFTARTKKGGEMLASEASTILFAAMRQGIELEARPYEIKPGHLCKWKIDTSTGNWEFTGRDVDYMFKSPVKTYENFPSHNRYYGGLVYDKDVTDVYPNIPLLASNASTYVRGRNDITITMAEVVSSGALKDWEMPHAQALDTYTDFQIRPSTKELVVEWVDYIKCNNRADCAAYYIIGRPLTTDESNTPTAAVYYTVYDKTEMEVMDIVAESIFTVTTRTSIMHQVKKNSMWVTTVYCTDIKPFTLTKEENAPQSQTH